MYQATQEASLVGFPILLEIKKRNDYLVVVMRTEPGPTPAFSLAIIWQERQCLAAATQRSGSSAVKLNHIP